jgi:DMSO/TMAO reductase YedYZ molybdopterin-dependent catalytic subunit
MPHLATRCAMGDDGEVSPAPRSLHVVAGVVVGLVGIAVSHTLTMLLTVRTSPLLAVAGAIIDIMPGPLVETLVQLAGHYDKPILVAGVALGALALCAWAGALGEDGRGPAVAVFVGMGVLGAAAVWTRPEARLYDVVPVVAGTLTWIIVLGVVTERLAALHRREPAEEGPGLARRRFLLEAGVLALAALVVASAGQVLGAGRRSVETARRLLRLPVSRGAVPRGAEVDVDGVVPWRTPNPSFYRIDTALVVPAIDPTTWRLRVHGMVERELDLTYRDLLGRELTEAWVTLCCVSNEVGGDLVGNAWWSGVRLADVLAEAGVRPGADAVLQTSEDGWTCATPVEALTDGRNALLATAMNGEPLPLEHGFPVRVVVPGLYGYVSATKWVVDLEVTRFADVTAYWTSRGWAPQAPVKTQSRIDVPRDGAEVPAGDLRIGGVAWAQQTGVEQVEYRLDGLPWANADLGQVPHVDTWVQWAGAVQVAPGSHTLAVRATDRSGSTQTAARTDVLPDGATGWHTVEFTAV